MKDEAIKKKNNIVWLTDQARKFMERIAFLKRFRNLKKKVREA